MNHLSKKQLKKVASIIESYLPLIQSLERENTTRTTTSIMYDSGLSTIARGTKLQAVLNKQKRFQNTKMVNAAKNLSKDFEDFGLTAYAEFFERTLSKIASLNGQSNLAPHKEEILATIHSDIQDFQIHADSFYQNLMTDIFNVGRQHQEVAGLRKEGNMNIKKYMSYTLDETRKFNKLNNLMQTELAVIMASLNDKLEESVSESFKRISYKDKILDNLSKVYSDYSFRIEDAYRKHCWRAYQVGNLHQLQRDGVKKVSWKTGHYVNDCLGCRAYETGNAVLHANGEFLSYTRDIDTIRYNLSDIIALSEYDSPNLFCHDDCRCFFVNADK